jgi:methionyl aminopeptidase
MSIESNEDWDGLRESGRITCLTLDALESQVRVGVSTGELDEIAVGIFRAHGAKSAPALVYGFPGTVLISINDEVVHGIPGRRRLRQGDLVKLDVTVEKDGYVTDAARSVVVGVAAAVATRLAACAESAFEAGRTVARAGARVSEIGRAVDREVRRQGFAVCRGLAGHGVGRTIHEQPTVPNHYDPRQRDVLTEGLVLTIEPMISAGSSECFEDADGWTIRTADGSLAAHHEHTLVITANGPVVLTGDLSRPEPNAGFGRF